MSNVEQALGQILTALQSIDRRLQPLEQEAIDRAAAKAADREWRDSAAQQERVGKKAYKDERRLALAEKARDELLGLPWNDPRRTLNGGE